MRRLLPVLVAVLAALSLAAAPAPPVTEGPVTDGCREAVPSPQPVCDGVRSVTHLAAATCRRAGAPEACTPLNGQVIDEAAIAAYEDSDVSAVLAIQRTLAEGLPLRDTVVVSTHNSYNSYAYTPTLSRSDANQTYAIRDQLRMDVRRLELDVHLWFAPDGSPQPTTCHATDEPNVVDNPVTRHTGCTWEDHVGVALAEIAGWLAEHPDELVMIRFEPHLDGPDGFDLTAAAIEETLGALVHRPAGSGCTPLPLDLTLADVRAAGKQVLLVGDGCGDGSTAWTDLVHRDSGIRREFGAFGPDFTYPTCGGITREEFASSWIRVYDDATFLSSATSLGGTAPRRAVPSEVREWTRCGVNQPGFDHLTPTDGRLAALVWSFEPGAHEPTAGDCATTDGTLAPADCGKKARYLCASADGFAVTSARGRWHGGFDACADEGLGTFATPRTGHEAELVSAALDGRTAWVSLRHDGTSWRLGCTVGGARPAPGTRGPHVTCP